MIRFFLTLLSVIFVNMPAVLFAEPIPDEQPFSVALGAGAGYNYYNGSNYTDFRIAMSPRSYIKFGYRANQAKGEKVSSLYMLLAGFMTTPKTGRGPTRGYLEFGAGFGGASEPLLVAAEGGVLIPFARGSNFGLDLGLFFLGSFFDSDAGTSASLGAKAGFVVLLGPKP